MKRKSRGMNKFSRFRVWNQGSKFLVKIWDQLWKNIPRYDLTEPYRSNTNQTRTTRTVPDVPPPDWLKTTMARIVPSLQLAKTEHYILTPYTYTFGARSRIFLHTVFFARHYSLPPRQTSVFARLARWQ